MKSLCNSLSAAGWARILVLALFLQAPAMAEGPVVTITEPEAGLPTFGMVTFAAEILEGQADSVVFLVDGEEVARLTSPPFRVQLDVGQENRERRFEIRAVSADGGEGSAILMTPAIRVDDQVDAELRQLYVTVSRENRRILNLPEESFRVYDGRRAQRIVTFSGGGGVRITAALLIDSSTSMKGKRLRYALRGAEAFLRGLKSKDDATLILFSDRLLLATEFSNDPEALTSGLGRAKASGGTALNDHLYLALKRLEAQQGRRVVVVLSDGIDSHSSLRMSDVGWLSQRSRALIYWIRVNPSGSDPTQRVSTWKDAEIYREEYRLLVKAVESSGGRIVDLNRLQDAESAFQEILDELREQYVIGYYPSSARKDGSFREVEVEVEGFGLDVRALRGYIDQ